ncbi:MAG: hypothetical protein J6A22_05200 [Bacteroidales bacterium]|nr:hypothetical protein [Bacteroidales bacterium]
MIRNLLIACSTALLLLAATDATAQNEKGCDWKERMMSEKIAFFTSELNITPEEAQAFWPVYNALSNEFDALSHKVMQTYKELETAVNENKGEGELSKRLDAYLKAREDRRALNNRLSEEYKKVLPIDKVAKLYVAEERFRREQIHKLHPKKNHSSKER